MHVNCTHTHTHKAENSQPIQSKKSRMPSETTPEYLQQEETQPTQSKETRMPSETTPEYLKQEETLTQEFKDFISNLPKEKGWLASHLYWYQGFWCPVRYLQGVISCQKNFKLQDSDIFLVSTPKSGTTWLKAIMFTLVNRSRYPIATNHPLITHNPHDLVPFLEIKHYVENQMPACSPLSSPRLFSTHLPHVSLPEQVQSSPACKMVYLCRNPKDIFVSMWHFCNSLKPREAQMNSISEVFDMFCRGVTLFGPVWDHALGYWNKSKEYPERVMFLKFEDMKEKPGAHIRRLAEFLGCPFSGEEEEAGVAEEILEMCSFGNMRAMEVNKNGKLLSGEENKAFFRKGVVGDWKNYLKDEMVDELDRITQEKFSGSGLTL